MCSPFHSNNHMWSESLFKITFRHVNWTLFIENDLKRTCRSFDNTWIPFNPFNLQTVRFTCWCCLLPLFRVGRNIVFSFAVLNSQPYPPRTLHKCISNYNWEFIKVLLISVIPKYSQLNAIIQSIFKQLFIIWFEFKHFNSFAWIHLLHIVLHSHKYRTWTWWSVYLWTRPVALVAVVGCPEFSPFKYIVFMAFIHLLLAFDLVLNFN